MLTRGQPTPLGLYQVLLVCCCFQPSTHHLLALTRGLASTVLTSVLTDLLLPSASLKLATLQIILSCREWRMCKRMLFMSVPTVAPLNCIHLQKTSDTEPANNSRDVLPCVRCDVSALLRSCCSCCMIKFEPDHLSTYSQHMLYGCSLRPAMHTVSQLKLFL